MLHFKNFSLDLDSDAVILDKECKNDYTETLKKFKTIPEQILNLSLLGFTPVHFNNEISNVELDDLSVILLPTEIKLQKSQKTAKTLTPWIITDCHGTDMTFNSVLSMRTYVFDDFAVEPPECIYK